MELLLKFIIIEKIMAQLELQPVTAGKSRRRLPATIRIDMTPMVDLGFLLITFFIFTTTMSEHKSMNLSMPKNGPPTNVKQSRSLSFILANHNNVYAWEGQWEEALKENRIITTGYDVKTGIGKLIREKQAQLEASDKDGKEALTLVIKPAVGSNYKNIVDVLDETLINNVKRYAIVDLAANEKEYLKNHGEN